MPKADRKFLKAFQLNGEHTLHGFGVDCREDGQIYLTIGVVDASYPTDSVRESLNLLTLKEFPEENRVKLLLEVSEFLRIPDVINHTTKILQLEIKLCTQLEPTYRKGQSYSFHLSESDFLRRVGDKGDDSQFDDLPLACYRAESWETPKGKSFFQKLSQQWEANTLSDEAKWAAGFLKSRGLSNENLVPRRKNFRWSRAKNNKGKKTPEATRETPAARNQNTAAAPQLGPLAGSELPAMLMPTAENSISKPSFTAGLMAGVKVAAEFLWRQAKEVAPLVKNSMPYVKNTVTMVFKGALICGKAAISMVNNIVWWPTECEGGARWAQPERRAPRGTTSWNTTSRNTESRNTESRNTESTTPTTTRFTKPTGSLPRRVIPKVTIPKVTIPKVTVPVEEEKSDCVICFSEKATRKFLPCNHPVACGDCYETMRISGFDRKCPICRECRVQTIPV